MMISGLRLQHFRSYKDESFEFEPSVNIVVGPNASGKTNLLEAVYVLGFGGSYKAKDQELIEFRRAWSRLEGYFGKQTRVLKLQAGDQNAVKDISIDGKTYRRLSLERTVPMVLFEPNHLLLITRGPEPRRDFVDGLLERSQPGFKTLAASYRRALNQRNALLKRGSSAGRSQLFAWNIRLSEIGGQIAMARAQLVDKINQEITTDYSRIAGHRSRVKLTYEAQFKIENYASRMLSKLEHSAEGDYLRGFTAHGPHREDITFYLNNRLLGQTASRGETRSLLLALKMFECRLIEEFRGSSPILLLDDVFSELDGSRRRTLVEFLDGRQAITTTTDADAAIKHFAGNHSLIPISQPA